MPIKTYRPTTQTLRYRTTLVNDDITTKHPHKPLVEPKPRTGGRRNSGDTTMRFIGGGHKRKLRIIDFKRDKTGIPATVTTKQKAALWSQVLTDIQPHPDLVIASGQQVAWVMRKNNPQLKQLVDEFVSSHAVGTSFGNTLLRVAQFSSESTDLRLFFKSVSMATTSSTIAVLIAFPVAYYLAFCVEKTKYTWLLIVITPFLTSYLLRIFAWKVVLGDQGLINSGLASLGVISADKPLSFLIYSQFTVMVVLTYAWVPFICLPIFIALENMDRRLLEAATDLGASRAKAFRKITLPLAAPGIVAAFLFLFIPSIGEYITPSLVGGTKGYMFGQAVADHFVGGAFDWQGGSVLALFLLMVVLFLTATTSKFLRAGGGTA